MDCELVTLELKEDIVILEPKIRAKPMSAYWAKDWAKIITNILEQWVTNCWEEETDLYSPVLHVAKPHITSSHT